MLGESKVTKGKLGAISIMEWASKRVKREVRSSLAAEVHSLASTLEASAWARVLWSDLLSRHFNVAEYRTHLRRWPLTTCIDCRSIYDHFHKLGGAQQSSDRRTAIELRVVRQQCQDEAIQLRWIEGRCQLADCLTKSAAQKPHTYLINTINGGRWAISSEAMAMEERAKGRDEKTEKSPKSCMQCFSELEVPEQLPWSRDEKTHHWKCAQLEVMRKACRAWDSAASPARAEAHLCMTPMGQGFRAHPLWRRLRQ